ncbi:hypothetical protein EDB83DRAFT_2525174 [Lactarius deliciosus]|nr:hypothetical protein EDB83DRAFT_2525174 [Lactarius deliciosus]
MHVHVRIDARRRLVARLGHEAVSSSIPPHLPLLCPRRPSAAAASSRFQDIFNAALKSYQKQTKKDLIAHPLASQLQSYQVQEFDQAHSGDERFTKWLIPTVNVLYAFSAAVSEGVGLVFSPAKTIFAGIGDVAASKDTLAELFERIGFFFNRLESYTEVTPTAAMTNIITKIMVEVLTIFGIATKELRRGSATKFLKKLAGMTDLEDAVKKLDRLTQEEARMALAEVLKITHIVRDDVKVVDVDDVGDKVDDVGSKVEDIGDRVQSVDEKIQVVMDDGKETRVVAAEAKSIIQLTANSVDELKWNHIRQLLRTWLSPADPSTNHNIARKAQHKGTAVWFFQGSIFIEWRSTGTLLWIHGKPGSGKSVICSSVIQDIMAVCEARISNHGLFLLRFSGSQKAKPSRPATFSRIPALLLALVLAVMSFTTLQDTRRLLGRGPTFIVLDALDECPDSPGIPSPRHEVLELVKELVDLHLDGLHICATSRPEVDIRAVLEPLASRSVSLHNQTGQQTDIADYVRNNELMECSDGYFASWMRCNIASHRTSVNFLMNCPESLDETYERILRGINKAQKDNARRLLQSLAESSSGGIPKLKDDWRWDDQEEAATFDFSHFSVKEYLTSPRLAQSQDDVSRFHIDLEAAHTILAQACLGTLLRLDEHANAEGFPLVDYAARRWVDHARFDGVSSLVREGMDDLFDSSKPHFAAWLRMHDMDERWGLLSYIAPRGVGSPLYYAAFCGFYDLAERLIMKHPEQVNTGGGRLLAPLPAAVYNRHFSVADLLRKHGADMNLRDECNRTTLHSASIDGNVDIMRWLLANGADANAQMASRQAPLHVAALNMELDAVRLLLEHNADPNSRNDKAKLRYTTPCISLNIFRRESVSTSCGDYWSTGQTQMHVTTTTRLRYIKLHPRGYSRSLDCYSVTERT